ncbi:MAG: T9SS type A sorting domain-containing protein [Saprospiraceae bacterium]
MSHSIRPYLLATAILSIVLAMALMPLDNEVKAYHSEKELQGFRKHLVVMDPVDSSQYFPTSTHCRGCHSTDLEGFAMVDKLGNDINMQDDWQASMMANSAKDPFWRAKVSHETLTHPAYKTETEDKCTTCHAPMGNYTSKYHGNPHYGIDDLLLDTMGLDGVSCAVCHQMSEEKLGDLHSGEMIFDTINRALYGPYPIPFDGPMIDFVGFAPVYSERIHDAGICASCHTLITETFDPATLAPNGDTYVEQATYHEWLNSQFNVDNITCQACHLPQIGDSVVISDNFLILQERFPYGLHELAGGNTMMLKLMKANKIALGIPATDQDFNDAIASTFDMLQNRSVDISVETNGSDLDSLFLEVKLKNKAGHKFPSGYPSRRAFLEMLVITTDNDTLFHSGEQTDNFEIVGHDPYFEPHYDVINQEDQVQIYEVVPADVNGNFTSILERAAYSLKDNRLPPLGFTTSHEVYDTTLIVGNALTDDDFNFEDNMEGSATDKVRYHIARDDFNGGYVRVIARMYYQSIPPRWLEEMFAEETPEIDLFKSMYEEADRSTVLVGTASMDSVYLDMIVGTAEVAKADGIRLLPNPTVDGIVTIELKGQQELLRVSIYSMNGELVGRATDLQVKLPSQQGVYILQIETNEGVFVERVLRSGE